MALPLKPTTSRPPRPLTRPRAVGVVFASLTASVLMGCATWPAPDRPLPPAAFVPSNSATHTGECSDAMIQQVGLGFWIDATDCGTHAVLRVRNVVSEVETTRECELPCYLGSFDAEVIEQGAVYAISVCQWPERDDGETVSRCSADTYVTLDDIPPARP